FVDLWFYPKQHSFIPQSVLNDKGYTAEVCIDRELITHTAIYKITSATCMKYVCVCVCVCVCVRERERESLKEAVYEAKLKSECLSDMYNLCIMHLCAHSVCVCVCLVRL